jgi:hypothetical protein
VAAKYILAALAVAFLVMGTLRDRRAGISHLLARTWWLVGAVFATVSAWLFFRGRG